MSIFPSVRPATLLAVCVASIAAAAPRPAVAQGATRGGQPAGAINPATFSGLKYRMIGPARGGRVTAVTGVPSQPNLFYMGGAGGGIWKTTDYGQNWTNISDGQLPVGSMGAIEVSPSDPKIIFAGTGSSKIRSNVSIGRGIFKSVDAGKTWSFSGLRDVGQIAHVRPRRRLLISAVRFPGGR